MWSATNVIRRRLTTLETLDVLEGCQKGQYVETVSKTLVASPLKHQANVSHNARELQPVCPSVCAVCLWA